MVSIIVVNWNGKKFLKDCLNSLKKQTFRNFEVILVDNGSSDGSQEYVQKNFPEVKLIRLEKNYGLGKAFNIGGEESFKNQKIKYIALLNNDIKASQNWLEELILVAESPENKKTGIFASKILFMESPEIIFSTGQIFQDGHLQERGLLKKDKGQFDNKTEVIGASSTSCLYKKQMLAEIGLYKEEFFFYGVDMELSWRAKINGWGAKFAPKSIIYHKGNIYTNRRKNEKMDKKFAVLDFQNLIWMVKNYGTIKNKILLTLSLLRGVIFHWLKIRKIKPDWKIKLNYKSIINLWKKEENWLI